MKLILALFLVGFLSDLLVQRLDFGKLQLYRPFWNTYGEMVSAIIAGLITLMVGGLILLLSIWLFNVLGLNTDSWTFVLFATALAFVLGVIIDVLTNRGDWLGPTFRPWYDGMGATNAALWSGGLTFAFTVFVSLMLTRYVF